MLKAPTNYMAKQNLIKVPLLVLDEGDFTVTIRNCPVPAAQAGGSSIPAPFADVGDFPMPAYWFPGRRGPDLASLFLEIRTSARLQPFIRRHQ
jgi:hypothetical protein